ncbi:MAG: AI-2E family transporter [Pseudomonadota bacterium]
MPEPGSKTLMPDPAAPALRTTPGAGRRPIRLRSALENGSKLGLIGGFVILLVAALDAISFLAIPIVLALIIGLTLGPTQERLERRAGLRPMLAAGILMLTVIGVIYLAVLVLLAPLEDWLDAAPEIWAVLQERLAELQRVLLRVGRAAQELGGGAGPRTPRLVQPGLPGDLISTVAVTVPSLLAQIVLFGGTLFFYLTTRTRLRLGLLSLCVSRRARLMTAHILRDLERRTSAYLGTITLINIAFGLVVTGVLWLLGMPTPALWGALATLFNYALYLGPVALAAILFAVALAVYESALAALVVPLAYLGVNAIEGNLVTPALVGQRLSISPLLVFVSVAFWYWLWGPVGGLIAVPIVIIATVIVGHALAPHLVDRQPHLTAREKARRAKAAERRAAR